MVSALYVSVGIRTQATISPVVALTSKRPSTNFEYHGEIFDIVMDQVEAVQDYTRLIADALKGTKSASGIIGTEAAAKAAPDGYTLFMGTLGNFSVNPHLFTKMTVDPLRDFAPITLIASSAFVIVLHPEVAARSLGDGFEPGTRA